MPAKAKPSSELAVIVRDNLKQLTATTRYPKATLADICCVTRGTVSHWFSPTNPKLPSLECLMTIAEHYGIMIDTLLTESGEKYMDRRFNTYSDAFTILNECIWDGIIEAEDIHNRILKELCTMYTEARMCNGISDEDIGTWVKEIVARFCIQIPNMETMNAEELLHMDEIIDLIYDSPGVRTMDKLQTLENLAKELNNKDTVNAALKAIKETENNKSVQEILKELN